MTAMQDLKEDLYKSIIEVKEAFNEIKNELIRDTCKEAVRITLVEIIKRIDEELIELEKQQIINARLTAPSGLITYSKTTYLDEAEQYYRETFTEPTRIANDNINVTNK